MAEARQLLLDTGDRTRGWIVWSTGNITTWGGAPPVSEPPVNFTQDVIGGQIEDPNTPSGAVFYRNGAVVPFGGSGWDVGSGGYKFVRAVHANPSGANQGYYMLHDATVHKWGDGTPNLTWTPNLVTDANWVRGWEFDWSSGKQIVLHKSGSLQSSMGVTGYTAITRPGFDAYRAIAVRNFVDAFPRFYVAHREGWIGWGNGAEPARETRLWQGQDAVVDLQVISDGTGGDPLILAVLTAWGGVWTWTASTAPTVDVVAPTGTVSDTTRPTVRWDYDDAEGDAQFSYHVVVVDEATATTPGFDPRTTTAAWENIYGEDRNTFAHTITRDLYNGNWRAYVRVADTAGDHSSYDHSTFEVDIVAPPTPVIDAVTTGAWTVTVAAGAVEASGGDPLHIDVESTDLDPTVHPETQWTALRGPAVPDGDDLIWTDHEAPLNSRRWYRARSRQEDPTVVSPWSDTVSAYVLEPAKWLLSAPLEIGDPLPIAVVPDVEWSQPVPTGVQRPPGRRDAIALRSAGGRQSAETTLTIRTLGRTGHDRLLDLLDGTKPLLLRSPYGLHWYVEVTGTVQSRMLDAVAPDDDEVTVMRHAHETTVDLIETGRPDV